MLLFIKLLLAIAWLGLAISATYFSISLQFLHAILAGVLAAVPYFILMWMNGYDE